MQIAQLNTSSGIGQGVAGVAAGAPDQAASVQSVLSGKGVNAPESAPARPAPAPLRRGLSSWDHQLQGEISSAQQALDFLEQSAGQLQALKNELLAKLDARAGRDGQVEARVRQFSATWRNRASASGGTLDAQLSYSSPEPASQRFSIRGLTMANLQAGGREVLSFSVGGSSQNLSSVNIEPGLSAQEIVQRFDNALAPANIRVSAGANGALVFSTPEPAWAGVRDTLAVRGSGIRFPDGQLSRVKTDEEAPIVAPEGWSTADIEALRSTLRQVVQALAQVQLARDSVNRALSAATSRADAAQPIDIGASMELLANQFITTAGNSDYESLRSISSSLQGVSRQRVLSLLSLR
ncbi:MAG: hypothetical protein H7Z39_00055 [Burkholderiaceae bacterium]|nr:hypothetical protein [Burkholderiaceae bacterium]